MEALRGKKQHREADGKGMSAEESAEKCARIKTGDTNEDNSNNSFNGSAIPSISPLIK